MKKIVSAAALAAAAASLATAEVTVTNNIRVRPNLYSITNYTEKGTTDAYSYSKLWDLDGFAGSKDTLGIKGSTDYAGVVTELTINGSDNTVAVDNYYGWLNWGAFKLTGGKFDLRYTNRGNYTATEQGILDEEFSKTMGLSSKNGMTTLKVDTDGDGKTDTALSSLPYVNWLVDFGNVAGPNGEKNHALLGEYTLDDIGGGQLLLRAGLAENSAPSSGKTSAEAYDEYNVKDSKVVTTGEDGFTQSAGYVFEAAWAKDDLAKFDFVFKNPLNKAYGFGLYVTPLMIPNTKNVVVGFTYGTMKDVIDSAFAVDFRAQYNITPEAVFALGAKYESLSVKDADAENAMQVAGEFSYKVNDLLTAALDFGYFNTDLDDNDDNKDDGSQYINVSGRAKFSAGKNAAVTTALRYVHTLNPADGGAKGTFDIPVVLRIKM
ncbi:hypothetical protein [Treponema saccharophilum]|uniref:hypothetical protein n=1 Tax=Treponema saccharophilum TaxID=165 RepID=UPI0038655741